MDKISRLFMLLVASILLVTGQSEDNENKDLEAEWPMATVENIRQLLEQFSYKRHHSNPADKDKARNYIWNFFNNLPKNAGETTDKQTYMSPFLDANNNKLEGINYILTRPGKKWGTAQDKPIVVAAHYDTRENTPGTDDNGSGCTGLLEVARVISNLKSKAEYTIMFVSFDMEEWIPLPGAVRQSLTGSREFVKSYLIPHVLDKYAITGFQGAIILETMLSYNDTPNSQVVVEGAKQAFPVKFKEIEANEHRGDFLSMIGRSVDAHLLRSLESNWHKLGNAQYKPLSLQLPQAILPGRPSNLSPKVHSLVRDFFRSDHYVFWDSNYTTLGLPGVMLSDTAEYRGYMVQCYHNPCDTFENAATDDNLAFLKKTTDTVIGTLLELSEHPDYKYKKTTSAASAVTTVNIIAVLAVAIACIY